MRPSSKLPILVLLATFLAGCAAAPAATDSTDAPAPGVTAAPAEVSDTTGGIEGVVVDDAINPIANAQVGIDEKQAVTVTDASGAFSFGSLEPGRYTLFAGALGFDSVGQSVEVEAGAVTNVRFTLATKAIAVAYPETLTFAGLIECGWGISGAGTGNCLPIQFIIDQFNLANPTNTRTTGQYLVADPANAFQGVFEMMWDPSAATTAAELRLLVEAEDVGAVGGTGYADEDGTSPVRAVTDDQPFKDLVENGNQKIQTRTFPAARVPPTTVVNQRFTVFATVCYNAECGEMFTVLPDA